MFIVELYVFAAYVITIIAWFEYSKFKLNPKAYYDTMLKLKKKREMIA